VTGLALPSGSSGVGGADLAWATGRAQAWDALLAGAASANPFHGRAVVAAHAAAGLDAPRFVAVAQGDGLDALLPFRRVGLGFGRALAAWTGPFVPNGTPLLRADRLEESAAALLDAMAALGPLWRLPFLALDSAAGQALLAAADRRGLACEVLSSFERAVLDRETDFEAWESRHLSANRRKDLRRRRRRLAERGALEHREVTGGGLPTAIETFLALEARGWKGRRGTALASRPETAALARALFRGGGPIAGRADLLVLDGRPVAASLALVCRGTAHLLKTAYDEDLARFAPGLLLEHDIVRACHAGFADRLDSVALAGCVLDGLYPGRERMGDLLIATDPGLSRGALARLAARERTRQALRARLGALYWRAVDAVAALRPQASLRRCQPTTASGRESVEAK
jgi:CelD/BcsL family acetyltransferase involved in cellulose biosynthesis